MCRGALTWHGALRSPLQALRTRVTTRPACRQTIRKPPLQAKHRQHWLLNSPHARDAGFLTVENGARCILHAASLQTKATHWAPPPLCLEPSPSGNFWLREAVRLHKGGRLGPECAASARSPPQFSRNRTVKSSWKAAKAHFMHYRVTDTPANAQATLRVRWRF